MQNKLLANLLTLVYWLGILLIAFGISDFNEHSIFIVAGLLFLLIRELNISNIYEKDYYQLVNKYNMLAEKHNNLIDSYKKHVDAYDKSMEEIDNIKQGIEEKLKEL